MRRFRSVEEMEQPRWRDPGDPELYRTIARLWDFGRRTARGRLPSGVYRHRTVEALGAQTERWSIARMAARRGDAGRS